MSCSSSRPSSRVYSLRLIQCTLCHTEILSTDRMFECCTPTAKTLRCASPMATRQHHSSSELGEHRERMDAFLDFIGASATDPRRTQEAIYSSHVYGPAHKQVKAISRLVQGALCLGGDHTGDMLGETQWQWLESQLKDSTAAFHIIVSTVQVGIELTAASQSMCIYNLIGVTSVVAVAAGVAILQLQVLTSVPIPESWGHFPKSKARLLQLLDDTKPRGTMLISGDVHLAELISGIKDKPPSATAAPLTAKQQHAVKQQHAFASGHSTELIQSEREKTVFDSFIMIASKSVKLSAACESLHCCTDFAYLCSNQHRSIGQISTMVSCEPPKCVIASLNAATHWLCTAHVITITGDYYMWENFGSMSIDWSNKQQQQQPQQQHDAAADASAAAAAAGVADAHKHSGSSSSTSTSKSSGSDDAAACIAMCDGVCAAVATFRVHNAHGVPVLQTTKSSCTSDTTESIRGGRGYTNKRAWPLQNYHCSSCYYLNHLFVSCSFATAKSIRTNKIAYCLCQFSAALIHCIHTPAIAFCYEEDYSATDTV
eukprot:8076-Heterococcus_DN1.PRE.1